MSDSTVERTICRMCHGGCGALVTVRNGKVISLRGDPDNPNSHGFLCAKGLASVELLTHPDRLRQPLRRVGPRGAGKFEPISWEDAYSELAARLQRVRAESGAESVVFAQGTDRNYQEWLFRFANAFGSPNVLGPAHVCFYPRVMAGITTMGGFTFCDYEATPDCLLVWGSNKLATHGDGVIGVRLLEALKRGTQLIVVDPRKTSLAQRARYWLRITPGTDAALALAFVNVVVSEDLFDRDFVEGHTAGFDALRGHLAQYTPESVAPLCGVPAPLIREAARFYARAASAAIEAGTGIEQNRHSFHTARALVILSGICGNIDRPGGDVLWEPSGIIGRRLFPASELLPAAQQGKRLGGQAHGVLAMAGWAHPRAVWQAILAGDPYLVRMLYVVGSNLMTNYADSGVVKEALLRVESLVVHELFMTPTAQMADLVLPISTWLEREQLVEHAHYVAARPQLVPAGGCRSDEQILNDLAHRIGLGAHFFSSVRASHDQRLAPLGLSFGELMAQSYRPNQLRYYKYKAGGFRTPSGKFNIHNRLLEKMGYASLPTYDSSGAGADASQGSYLLTSAHPTNYFNSEFRQLAGLRRKTPEPLVEMHPDAAAREGVKDADWVRIWIGDRSAQFRVRTTAGIHPGVVCAAAGWWYPELPGKEGWRRSNLNLLTSNGDENPEMGSSNLRGVRCRIERC